MACLSASRWRGGLRHFFADILSTQKREVDGDQRSKQTARRQMLVVSPPRDCGNQSDHYDRPESERLAQCLRRLSRFWPFAASYLRGDVRVADNRQICQRRHADSSSNGLLGAGGRTWTKTRNAGISGRTLMERVAWNGRPCPI